MAVLSLFETATRRESRSSADRSARGRNDIGRLSRERRLAFYRGACLALGMDPAKHPLRFVRCDDGRLRLFDPSRTREPLRHIDRRSQATSQLERELDAAAIAIAGGGGISYLIDLETGDLRVHEMVSASAAAAPPSPPATPSRRHGTRRPLVSSRAALR